MFFRAEAITGHPSVCEVAHTFEELWLGSAADPERYRLFRELPQADLVDVMEATGVGDEGGRGQTGKESEPRSGS